MSNIIKLQALSITSRVLATLVGIVQSALILRLITPEEYGLVNIALGVAGVVGVYQGLGLTSGTTREVSAAGDRQEAGKVLLTSLITRLVINLPLSLGLFFAAPYLARQVYGYESLILPLRIMAVILFVQANQGICNSAIAGLQQFNFLFVFQAAIALVSLGLYLPLIYYHGWRGYFYATLAFNVVSSLILLTYVYRLIGGILVLPTRAEFKKIFRSLLTISLSIFAVKILFTVWEKLGPLFLGRVVTASEVGIFSLGLFYSSKLMTFSDALTDVNLPLLSRQFARDEKAFVKTFAENNRRTLAFISLAAASAIWWAWGLIKLVAGPVYLQAIPLIAPLILAYWFYSQINLYKSGILIPARLIGPMLIAYLLLLGGTFLGLAALPIASPLLKTASALAWGGGAAYLYLVFTVYRRFQVNLLGGGEIVFFLLMVLSWRVVGVPLSFWIKLPAYLIFLTVFVGVAFRRGLVTYGEVNAALQKVFRR